MNIDRIKALIRIGLDPYKDVLFAYLHGSALHSDHPNDIDIALYLKPNMYAGLQQKGALHIDFILPLEQALCDALRQAVDVQLLNNAPLAFKNRAMAGMILLDRDKGTRADFENLARVEYFDFKHVHRSYLKAALA